MIMIFNFLNCCYNSGLFRRKCRIFYSFSVSQSLMDLAVKPATSPSLKNSTTTWTSKPDFRSSSFSTEFKQAIMGTQVQSSWADEIEDGDTNTLPLPSEKIVDNKKYTTEYSINDDGKKIKIVRTFEIIKKQVPKSVAQRKALGKFGMSRNDRPGTPIRDFFHF